MYPRAYTCLLVGFLILGLIAASLPAAAQTGSDTAAELSAQEKDLVAELLAINLDIMKLRQEREAQQQKLEGIRRSIRIQEADLAQSEVDLAEARARLGDWLRHHYENGRWSYLEILLGTQDFGEFFGRLEMLQMLIRYEAGLYDEVQRLNQAIKSKIEELEGLYAEARREEEQIARQLAEIEETKAKRVRFLDEIRRQSEELAERITEIEQGWQASLQPLHNVLSQLNVLLVRELKPDRITFEGLGIRLEVSAASVNRAIRSASRRPGDSLSVSLGRNVMTISGRSAADQSEFILTGRLVPTEEGTAVFFRPQSLTVNGTRIQPELLPLLNRDGGLSFSLGQNYRLFSVSQIRHDPDKVVVILKRG